ncbi:threonine-phosphate decarboxylase CobD [Phreatobacter cathodiphilus]|uniref:threonine-phosphate decarboxylase n=1 Tax=Phreatobacter cathodiphilus TaxID=1868589 RepID=A0A2S0NEH0_9HYPH|nr:threonine-phosphate decarboxylase CobD [Phreatobacter cathodiphilus]AVO46552.1 threonine-phosphate decarboxylase [Phreatobacter cathodiphilus]
MNEPESLWHGGDLGEARRLFPGAPEPFIDLSTGINPVPYPLPALPSSLWQRLPAAEDEAALLAAARGAYGVPAHAGIVAAPGTQILIDLLPRLMPRGTTAVLGPTYGEHAAAWARAGHGVREVATPEEAAGADVLVVVNPNNPDGRILPREALAALASGGGLLVVDEAFADFTPAVSLTPALPPATLVLRSFGKTYGLAGLRLGFAVGDPALIARLSQALGRWPVAGPALAVGTKALTDEAWFAAASLDRAADAARLDAMLGRIGTIVGGTALYRLVETDEAPAWFARLGAAGIYVRRFAGRPHLLRFGLPGDDAAWSRLAAVLTKG